MISPSSFSRSPYRLDYCLFQLNNQNPKEGQRVHEEAHLGIATSRALLPSEEVLEEYIQIGDPIGDGAFSTILKVSKAFHLAEYALKIPKSTEWNKDLLNESKILRFLRSQSLEGLAGIVKWKETFWLDSKIILVLELLHKDLNILVQETKGLGLSIVKATSLMRQLCVALSTLKRFDVIHLDIKPANVAFVEGDIERMKLIDFEGAFFKDSPPKFHTNTVAYSGPEVLLSQRPYDSSSDMWSCAVTVLEAYLGRSFFEAATKNNKEETMILQQSRFRKKYPEAFQKNLPIDAARSTFDALINASSLKKTEDDIMNSSFVKVLRKMFVFEREKRITPEKSVDLLSTARTSECCSIQ